MLRATWEKTIGKVRPYGIRGNGMRALASIGMVVAIILCALVSMNMRAEGSSQANVLKVPEQYATIQTAIDAAVPGDTIEISAGTYDESIAIDVANLKLVGAGSDSTTIDGGGSDRVVYVDRADCVEITGLTITNGYNGISASFWTHDLTISNNQIVENDNYAIVCGDQSSSIAVIENVIAENSGGVNIYGSISCEIKRNSISDCYGEGIGLEGASWKSEGSSNNIVEGNTISNNGVGVSVNDFSDNNRIFHNNFVSNTVQADASGYANYWDNGPTSGGNYWSDYPGADTNGDGIGDSPYPVGTNNQDMYPFIDLRVCGEVVMALESESAKAGSEVLIEGSVSPARGGVSITIEKRVVGEDAWTSLATVTTDASGHYSYTWKADDAGSFELRACWSGDPNTFPSQSQAIQIEVKESGGNILVYVIAAVALACVFVILAVLIMRRKRK
jgi:parallel beta-helix repeat protein